MAVTLVSTNRPSGGYALPLGAEALALQTDGKALVLGPAWEGPESSARKYVAYRFTQQGSLDTTFGNNGTFEVSIQPFSLDIQDDGKIVVGGQDEIGALFFRWVGVSAAQPTATPQPTAGPTPIPTPSPSPTPAATPAPASGGGGGFTGSAFLLLLLGLSRLRPLNLRH